MVEEVGRNCAWCMKERKEKEELYMVDHGSVFNLKQRSILGSGRIQQGTCWLPLLQTLLKTRKQIFIKSRRIYQAPVLFPNLNRVRSKAVKSEYAKGPSTGQR